MALIDDYLDFVERNRSRLPTRARELIDLSAELPMGGSPTGMFRASGKFIPSKDPIKEMLLKRQQLRKIREAISKSWRASIFMDNAAERAMATGDAFEGTKYLARKGVNPKDIMGEAQLEEVGGLVKQLERETEPLRQRIKIRKSRQEINDFIDEVLLHRKETRKLLGLE